MTAVRKLGEIQQAAGQDKGHGSGQEFEGEIREFIRRDVSLRGRRPQDTSAEPAVENVSMLIDRVSGASVEEIDRLIRELQALRETLRSEGERVRRELTGYAGLSQSAMTSLRMIADTLTQVRPDGFSRAD